MLSLARHLDYACIVLEWYLSTSIDSKVKGPERYLYLKYFLVLVLVLKYI